MEINYSALKKKEVLNLETGKNLGKINDLIIDAKSGKILKIIVPGKKGFLSCENEEIKFSDIEKIGDDVILVSKRSKNCNSNCQNSSVIPPSSCCGQQNGNSSISFDYDEE